VIGIETAVRVWTVRGSNPRTARDFSLLRNVQTGSEAHPASYSMRDSFLGVKRPGPEVNYSPPSSAEAKTEWIYTSSPLYAFMTWTGKTLPFFRGLTEPHSRSRC